MAVQPRSGRATTSPMRSASEAPFSAVNPSIATTRWEAGKCSSAIDQSVSPGPTTTSSPDGTAGISEVMPDRSVTPLDNRIAPTRRAAASRAVYTRVCDPCLPVAVVGPEPAGPPGVLRGRSCREGAGRRIAGGLSSNIAAMDPLSIKGVTFTAGAGTVWPNARSTPPCTNARSASSIPPNRCSTTRRPERAMFQTPVRARPGGAP